MDIKEIKFTSTDNKLLANTELIDNISKGNWRPQSIQLSCTDRCNLRCVFCSVDNRNGDTIPFDKVMKTLDEFRELWAKTVELTWGGDPTQYPQINETIEYAHNLGYEIGMISNGIALRKNIKQENLDKLTRLRVSLNSLDYVEEVDVPHITWTLGFSYVWNEKSNEDRLQKISEYVEKYWAEFVRIVPNCLTAETKEQCRIEVEPLLGKYPKMFFQAKEHNVPEKCWIGYVKPFIASDGNIYMCSANPLVNRKFDQHWKIGSIDDIKTMYEKVKHFDTSKCQKGKCFFKWTNDMIWDIIEWKALWELNTEIPHKNFL